jgi:hypothetical protein
MSNLPMLIYKIENAWRPEHDIGIPSPGTEQSLDRGSQGQVTHYLYFAKKTDAQGAYSRANSIDTFEVLVERSKADVNWSVKVMHDASVALDDATEKLMQLAEEFGGEYDGHEVRVG